MRQYGCGNCHTIPGLPGLPGASSNQDPLSQLGDQVGDVLGDLGLGRSGTGWDQPWNDKAHGGPTMAQLQAVYDPSLVNLLVPALVVPDAGPTKPSGGRAK